MKMCRFTVIHSDCILSCLKFLIYKVILDLYIFSFYILLDYSI